MTSATFYEYGTDPGSNGSLVVGGGTGQFGGISIGSNLSIGDEIAFNGKAYVYVGGADVGASGGPEVGFFATNNGTTYFFSTDVFSTSTPLFQDAAEGYTVTCFARNTRLATQEGAIAVEDLAVGAMVATQQEGKTEYQRVKWVGRRSVNITAHPRPEVVAPIRIQGGAFADNVPCNDLLVSPDHAIFVDGKLVCARQLVNGATIRQDKQLAAVEYFHVEMDRHTILVAEGLPVESYLDTGNRGFFINADEPFVLHPSLIDEASCPTREAGSCAPFVWDGESVRPIWERLAARASVLGLPVPICHTTIDPDLCIMAQGRKLRPVSVVMGCHSFIIPKGATEVRLVSRAAVPTDVQPWMEDRRQLGVYVERMMLRCGGDALPISVDHPTLVEGWWAVERSGVELRRWTNGDAILPLPVAPGPVLLEIRIGGTGLTYVVRERHLQALDSARAVAIRYETYQVLERLTA